MSGYSFSDWPEQIEHQEHGKDRTSQFLRICSFAAVFLGNFCALWKVKGFGLLGKISVPLTSSNIRVLIVGAGIAGLSVAIALRQKGLTARVVEKRKSFDEEGTGLHLPGNAVRAAGELGLGVFLEKRATRISHIVYTDGQGRELAALDLTKTKGATKDWPPFMALRRSVFHRALWDRLNGPDIRLGVEPVDIVQVPDGAMVRFSDGTNDTFDLVIGADGVSSRTRKLLFPEAPLPEYMGYQCWRYITARPAGVTSPRYMVGEKRAMLVMPIDERAVYVYAMVCADDLGPSGGDLITEFENFGGAASSVLEGDDHRKALKDGLKQVALETWTQGNAVLIGDAAHATLPTLAQGAAMAMEDALVLAETLAADQENIPGCLEVFETRRRPRIQYVQEQSVRRMSIVRTEGQLKVRLRNAAFKMVGSRILRSGWAPLINKSP